MSFTMVECLSCHYRFDITYIKNYFLNILNIHPHCPKCKTYWSITFLRTTLSTSYVDQVWLPHYKKQIIHYETSRLPSYMPYVYFQRKFYHYQTKRAEYEAKIDILKETALWNYKTDSLRQEYTRKIQALIDQPYPCLSKYYRLHESDYVLQDPIVKTMIYVYPCPECPYGLIEKQTHQCGNCMKIFEEDRFSRFKPILCPRCQKPSMMHVMSKSKSVWCAFCDQPFDVQGRPIHLPQVKYEDDYSWLDDVPKILPDHVKYLMEKLGYPNLFEIIKICRTLILFHHALKRIRQEPPMKKRPLYLWVQYISQWISREEFEQGIFEYYLNRDFYRDVYHLCRDFFWTSYEAISGMLSIPLDMKRQEYLNQHGPRVFSWFHDTLHKRVVLVKQIEEHLKPYYTFSNEFETIKRILQQCSEYNTQYQTDVEKYLLEMCIHFLQTQDKKDLSRIMMFIKNYQCQCLSSSSGNGNNQ